jgi:chloramphenicol-sensitive protein RarD
MASIEGAPATAGAAQGNSGKDAETRAGVLAALVAYGLWGFLPLLFKALEGVGSVTIVAERTVWSLLIVGTLLLASGRMGLVRAALAHGPTLRSMIMSSVILGGNWLLFIWAVETGHVLEASFGYFATPLANILIGMVFLGERQNLWQTVSIAIAVVAIAIQAIGVGGVPYIAIGLATSFAAYGYFRKTAKVASTAGLFVETLMLLPLALAYIVYTFIANGPGPHADPWLMTLLVATGPATAAPLLLFAFAVQRLRLTTIGMFQYIAPSIAFILAITVFEEPLNPVRLVSFVLIWVSLAVFTADSLWRRPKPA